MRGFLVSKFQESLFLVFEGFAMLRERGLFTEIPIEDLFRKVVFVLKLPINVFIYSFSIFTAVKTSGDLAEPSLLIQRCLIFHINDLHSYHERVHYIVVLGEIHVLSDFAFKLVFKFFKGRDVWTVPVKAFVFAWQLTLNECEQVFLK